MFQLIDGTSGLHGRFIEPDLGQESTADMIALDARLTTLAVFESRGLLAFTVQRLDLSAKFTHLLGGLTRILSGIMRHDPIRAVGRHLNPEQTHLAVFGETLNFNSLASGRYSLTPVQRVDTPLRTLTAGIIHLTVVFQRAIVDFLHRLYQHQVLDHVLRIHQQRVKRQRFLVNGIIQHLVHLIELAFAVHFKIINAVINPLKLIQREIDLNTGHHPDISDHGFGFAAVLATAYHSIAEGSSCPAPYHRRSRNHGEMSPPSHARFPALAAA